MVEALNVSHRIGKRSFREMQEIYRKYTGKPDGKGRYVP